jgi:4-hydroxy-4-methyl-2-oxoglutarate aldolase
MDAETSSSDFVQRAAALTTSGLSDAMDRLGIDSQVAAVRPLDSGHKLAGPAYTVLYRAVAKLGETVGDFIDEVPAGSVIVIDNQGRLDCTVWGDILTAVAKARHLAGTVIDGVCRDADAAAAVGYPVFARANWMRTGKDRVTVDRLQGPVELGGITVLPSDIVVGDRDGVVVIPAARAAEVLEVAERIESTEADIRAAVQAGDSLRAARARLGYHELQRAQDAEGRV